MNTTRGTYWQAKSTQEKQLQTMILDTLASRGLTGWTVIFSRESERLGYCAYGTQEICISRKVIGDWAQAVDTAMHEVAHALTPGASHGPRWKAMARELGAQPVAKVERMAISETGETRTVKTSYGPVTVTLGATVIQHEALGPLVLAEVRQRACVALNAQGLRYRIPVDRLHPNYGDSSKVPSKTVTLKDPRGRSVEVTIGQSHYVHGGVRFIAVEARRRNVLTVDSAGNRLLVPAEMLKD